MAVFRSGDHYLTLKYHVIISTYDVGETRDIFLLLIMQERHPPTGYALRLDSPRTIQDTPFILVYVSMENFLEHHFL